MLIQTPSDYLRLAGKRVLVSVEEDKTISGVVQDLSDTCEHLVLLTDNEPSRKVLVPLCTIWLVELADADPGLSEQLTPEHPKRKCRRRRSVALHPGGRSQSGIKVSYSPETDELYIDLSVKERNRRDAVTAFVGLDYDVEDRIVGISVSKAGQSIGFVPAASRAFNPMLRYDPRADSLHVRFFSKRRERSVRVTDGVVFEHDRVGQLVGIWIRHASKRLNLQELHFGYGAE